MRLLLDLQSFHWKELHQIVSSGLQADSHGRAELFMRYEASAKRDMERALDRLLALGWNPAVQPDSRKGSRASG